MKSSTARLRLDALPLIGLLLRERVGECFGVDEIDVPAYAAQVARGSLDGRFERPITAKIDVHSNVDATVGVGKFDGSPRGHEAARSACGHASQRRADLRNDSGLGELALQTDVADLTRAEEPD